MTPTEMGTRRIYETASETPPQHSCKLLAVAWTIAAKVPRSVGSHAQPAKLALALPTRHVVTSSVLLNRALALGARLGVGLSPLLKASVCCTILFLPLFELFTGRIGVPFHHTLPTKRVVTLFRRADEHESSLHVHGHAATHFGAPDNRSVVTQGRNVAAQRLYQSAGFRTAAVQLWHHCWFTHGVAERP